MGLYRRAADDAHEYIRNCMKLRGLRGKLFAGGGGFFRTRGVRLHGLTQLIECLIDLLRAAICGICGFVSSIFNGIWRL